MRWLGPFLFLAAACSASSSRSSSGSPSSGSSGGGNSSSGSSGSSGTSAGATSGGSSTASGGSASSGSSGGGSQSGSVQGFQSFTPNSVLTIRTAFPDGGPQLHEIEIGIFNSSPTAVCSSLTVPMDGGVITGEVTVFASQEGPITVGKYDITDYGTFGIEAVAPDGGLAALLVGTPTDPPGPSLAHFSEAVSGTVTFISVGPAWIGSFSAIIMAPGGSSPLSGTFNTTTNCLVDHF